MFFEYIFSLISVKKGTIYLALLNLLPCTEYGTRDMKITPTHKPFNRGTLFLVHFDRREKIKISLHFVRRNSKKCMKYVRKNMYNEQTVEAITKEQPRIYIFLTIKPENTAF